MPQRDRVWADRVKSGQIIPVTIWKQAIAVYRDDRGQLHALEDACPHKGVALHTGEVQGCNLLCSYHGWEFNGNGECVGIPYLPTGKKLPCAKARSYPVQEQYNLIWVFPGDPDLAASCQLPQVPEYGNSNWFMVPFSTYFPAHFSICNENSIDLFHGHLHQNLQSWFDPVLLHLSKGEKSVNADYRVSYKGLLTKLTELGETVDQVITRTLSIKYNYPHYYYSLERMSSAYLMRLPIGPTATRSFSFLFFKIPLPKWLLKLIQKPLASFLWRFVFKKFFDQDVEMIESEQRNYLANPHREYVEINPVVIALDRLIISQYEKFRATSSQFSKRAE